MSKRLRAAAVLVAWCVSAVSGCVERGEVLTPVRVEPPQRPEDAGASSTTGTPSAVTSPEDAAAPTAPLPTASLSGTTLPTAPVPSSPLPSTSSSSNPPDAGATVSEPPALDAQAPEAGVENDAASVNPDLAVVSAGSEHTCAVLAGALYCWGGNAAGQLGLGDAEARLTPTLLPGAATWLAVEAADQHSCALNTAGEVWCWGANDRGQLAQGDRQSRSTPQRVELPAAAVSVASVHRHTCVVLADARLFCWGENREGQLGQADEFPAQNENAADALLAIEVPGAGWHSAAVGQGHTCALASDRTLWCWGRNSGNELGGAAAEEQVRLPLQVGSDADWAQLSSGQNGTCGLKDNGSLWCWGRNVGDNDGLGGPIPIEGSTGEAVPTQVSGDNNWSSISIDTFHGCGLRADELWCWGRNEEGQLGTDDIELRATPALIGTGYRMVNAGKFYTCAVNAQAQVLCSGENQSGQLGTADVERRALFSPAAFTP